MREQRLKNRQLRQDAYDAFVNAIEPIKRQSVLLWVAVLEAGGKLASARYSEGIDWAMDICRKYR